MSYTLLRYDVTEAVATITLDRPKAFNALDVALAHELLRAVIAADEDAGVRCIVLTGAGKAFCAGGDVKGFAAAGAGAAAVIKELTVYFHGAVSRLVRAPKPVVAAVNGVAAGAGMSLAIMGDLVLAAESATFDLAYARIAASPDGGSTFLLPRLVGARRALEIQLTGRVLSAREAHAWGLVTAVHPDAELTSAAGALARKLAAGPTAAYGRAKQLFLHATEQSLETQMELEAQAIAASAHTEDFQAAVAAFAARSGPPAFKGR